MSNTVKWALLSLNPQPYIRVSVRRRRAHGFEYLGGGSASDCMRRFGDLQITDTNICDNCLCIYVL